MSGEEEDKAPPPEDPPQARAPEPEPAPEPEIFAEAPEPEPEPEPTPPPRVRPPVQQPEPAPQSYRDDEAEPDIPMPARQRRGGYRAREAQANLDLDLGRIKRRKRFGWLITIVAVLFIALVLAPVTWVAVYRFVDPPTITMMQRASEGQTIRHYPVSINRISPHVVRAVIAAEDSRFCSHDGFDFEAIREAMERNARGGRMRGASTVSQQTAKNLFLWQGRTWIRKGIEVYFTALIEFMWPKRRIMEAYLNAAEWGDGNFGIEAAARARFGVSAAELNPLQAARLAAVLPNPNEWRADNPGPRMIERSQMLMRRAREVRNQGLASCVLLLDRPAS